MAREHTWPGILGSLVEGNDLSISEAEWAMQSVMAGEATTAQLGGLLVALRMKGETVDEIVGIVLTRELLNDAVLISVTMIFVVRTTSHTQSGASVTLWHGCRSMVSYGR